MRHKLTPSMLACFVEGPRSLNHGKPCKSKGLSCKAHRNLQPQGLCHASTHVPREGSPNKESHKMPPTTNHTRRPQQRITQDAPNIESHTTSPTKNHTRSPQRRIIQDAPNTESHRMRHAPTKNHIRCPQQRITQDAPNKESHRMLQRRITQYVRQQNYTRCWVRLALTLHIHMFPHILNKCSTRIYAHMFHARAYYI